VPLETLLRIYFMQQWYGLSDPAMQDSLYDIEPMSGIHSVRLANVYMSRHELAA